MTKSKPLISEAIHGWLARTKSVTNKATADKDYLEIIKLLFSAGFSTDITQHIFFPLKFAVLHEKQLTGLLDLLVLYAKSTQVLQTLAPYNKAILSASINKANVEITKLTHDKKTYLYLLVPDIKHIVSRYAFKCIT